MYIHIYKLYIRAVMAIYIRIYRLYIGAVIGYI